MQLTSGYLKARTVQTEGMNKPALNAEVIVDQLTFDSAENLCTH